MNKLTPRFEDYERITDILLFLSDKFSLNFIVVLCSKDKNGAKRFFQFETETIIYSYFVAFKFKK